MAVTTAHREIEARAAAPCWACHEAVAGGALFCPACKAVQPPGGVDHFTRLGLQRGFEIDEAELDRRYFALQRQLHPDRFVTKSARERAISQGQASSLNEAYETLRDKMARAVYLLRDMGVELEPGDGATISDPELLMEAMEMREALAEARDAAAIAKVAAHMDAERKATLASLSKAFAANDRDAARGATLRLKYLTKLDDEIKARRAALRSRQAFPS